MRKFAVWSAGLVALVVMLMMGTYWYAGASSPELDDAARADLSTSGEAHSFVTLSDGTVHYRLEGAADSETVVLIHGFSTPSFVWEAQVASLTRAGYRVLTFDNYGRGFSDRPDAEYNADLTDRLVVELLEALEIAGPVHLVGYSMGGSTSAVFASRHPEKVSSVTFIATAGLGGADFPGWSQTPAADWIFRVMGPDVMKDRQASGEPAATDPEGFRAKFARQFDWGGTPRALLSSIRHYPFSGLEDAFGAINEAGIPALIIWGENDQVVPFADAAIAKSLLPSAEVIAYPDIGHALTYAQPELVTVPLMAFLAGVGG